MNIVRTREIPEVIDFADLDGGTCFVLDGEDEVLMKTGWEQDAVSLEDGEVYTDLCGSMVIIIKTELHIIE